MHRPSSQRYCTDCNTPILGHNKAKLRCENCVIEKKRARDRARHKRRAALAKQMASEALKEHAS